MTTLFLRIASIISLLFATGHTLGGLKKWSPMGDNEVLRAMTTSTSRLWARAAPTSTSSWDSGGQSASPC